MANTLDIRRRIRSVKNTAQITKAMQMVAASKMRKAQAAALAGRPFQDLIWRVLASLRGRVNPNDHELLRVRPVQKELVVVFSTDKGLCGALNTNLFRELAGLDSQKTLYVTCGRKAVQYMARTKRDLVADFPLGETPSIREIRPICPKAGLNTFLSLMNPVCCRPFCRATSILNCSRWRLMRARPSTAHGWWP